MRRAVAAVALAGGAVGLCACASSQQVSAQRARLAKGKAAPGTVRAGAANPDVRRSRAVVLRGTGGQVAVAVDLRNTGRRAQVAVPVQIDVRGRPAGRSLYKNDLEGLQTSLQQMAFLPAGKRRVWVDDQVTAPGATPATARVRIGRGRTVAAGLAPHVVLSGVRLDHDVTGPYATGRVRNLSRVAQLNLPIYGVARRDGRIVAAGRAIVERLAPEPQPKPTRFRIYFVGTVPKGAVLDVRPAPTTFEERK